MLMGVGGCVMDGIPTICSEHVRREAVEMIATAAVRQQFQWDSQDTCSSHHGASHAAGGSVAFSHLWHHQAS
jgi:hypothetical protein